MKTIGKVYFIGAGPGDPRLITVKGLNLVNRADLIIYAGSAARPFFSSCLKMRRPEDQSFMTPASATDSEKKITVEYNYSPDTRCPDK